MRPALLLRKSTGSASSSRWLARQSKDPYVKLRAQASGPSSGSSTAYRSRSSFKLVTLAAKHPILSAGVRSVVDLGAAPGGWSQVAAQALRVSRNGRLDSDRETDSGGPGQRMKQGAKIIAVDILGMDAIAGVEVLRGDFLDESVRDQVRYLAGGVDAGAEAGVDTVLSDMMAPMSGNRTRDTSLSLQLCSAATIFARDVLRKARSDEEVIKKPNGRKIYPGGHLVMKFFAHPDLDEFKKYELDPWFGKVVVEKPKESRSGG